MAVRIVSSKTFKTPVTFTELDEEGKPVTQSFVAEFKRLDRDAIGAVVKLGGDAAICREVMVGWKMEDENGQPVDFSRLEELLTKPGFAGCAVLEFMEKVGAARVKNS